jgi:hypothetical protein
MEYTSGASLENNRKSSCVSGYHGGDYEEYGFLVCNIIQ